MVIDWLAGGLHQLASHVLGVAWEGECLADADADADAGNMQQQQDKAGHLGMGEFGRGGGWRGMQMHAAAAVVVAGAGAGDAPHTKHHAAPGTSAAMTCDMGRCWMHVAMQPHACVSLWGTLDPPTTPRLLVPVFEFN